MPRTPKIGLDYFPLDTDIFQDRKTRKLTKQFGAIGALTYIHLLCEIYRDKGNHIVLDDDLIFDIAYNLKSDTTTIENVIAYCFKIDLFDSQFQAERKLTSIAIQERYHRAKAAIRKNGPLKPLQPQPVQVSAHQIDPKFDLWFKKFDYDTNHIETKNEWFELQPEEQDKCLKVVADYVKSTPDKNYRKKPHNYLREKCFNNEIITPKELETPKGWDLSYYKKLDPQQKKEYEKYLVEKGYEKMKTQAGIVYAIDQFKQAN